MSETSQIRSVMRTAPSFEISAEARLTWSNGSCGNPGCTDPECCCSLCGKPIGVSEDDPRWDRHDEYCDDCDLCRDQVPVMLFRGEGKAMQQAQFHIKCFEKIVRIKPGEVIH
ncbi:MAG TPA: hypothetical protein VKX49_12905 [Bryobacteraceae bacterium]|nr:hypothetical protein [Bryobacteraceae bacterium]